MLDARIWVDCIVQEASLSRVIPFHRHTRRTARDPPAPATVPQPFSRPVAGYPSLPSLAAEGRRLDRFAPPFRFTSFFSPEDTLLCVLATERALILARAASLLHGAPVLAELTAGSGLVGLAMMAEDPGARLFGTDVDPESPLVADANAASLGLSHKSRFTHMSLWDDAMATSLREHKPDLLICNPPYVPEPPTVALPVEAGAGPDGAAHLRRVIELAATVRPHALALSWCSLSDPAGVVRAAESAGYGLGALYVTMIADGEYSGGITEYLRALPTAYLNESPSAVAAVAPDGAARFAYLLMAGAFVDCRADAKPDPKASNGNSARTSGGGKSAAKVHDVCRGGAPRAAADDVGWLMSDFATRGVDALVTPTFTACPLSAFILDRWDEIALRARLHGAAARESAASRVTTPVTAPPA